MEYVDIPPELMGKPDPDHQWIEAQLDRINPWRHEQGHDGADTAALRKLVLELRHSLRDKFAAKAMPIMWDAYDKGYCGLNNQDAPNTQIIAGGAYQMADAMLKARAA